MADLSGVYAKIGDAHRGRSISIERREKIAATLRGTRHSRGKLSDEQIGDLIVRHKAGESYRSIARDFGVRMTSVRSQFQRRTA